MTGVQTCALPIFDRDSPAALERAFRKLEDDARAVMADTGLKLETAAVKRLADGRFLGQGFDLVVELPAGPYEDGAETRRRLTAAFETAYREKFALTPPDVPIEFINIRVAVRAPVSGQQPVGESEAPFQSRLAVNTKTGTTRPAYFGEHRGFVETTVYHRQELAPGHELRGPAVVEEEGSTLVIGPGGIARVAESGNVIVTLPADAGEST